MRIGPPVSTATTTASSFKIYHGRIRSAELPDDQGCTKTPFPTSTSLAYMIFYVRDIARLPATLDIMW